MSKLNYLQKKKTFLLSYAPLLTKIFKTTHFIEVFFWGGGGSKRTSGYGYRMVTVTGG